jgi:hypothetical protein
MYNELHSTVAPKRTSKALLYNAVIYGVSCVLLTCCITISGLQRVQAQELPVYRSKDFTSAIKPKVDTTGIKKRQQISAGKLIIPMG